MILCSQIYLIEILCKQDYLVAFQLPVDSNDTSLGELVELSVQGTLFYAHKLLLIAREFVHPDFGRYLNPLKLN